MEGRLRSLRFGSAGRFLEDANSGGVARLARGLVLAVEEAANDGDEMILDGGWP